MKKDRADLAIAVVVAVIAFALVASLVVSNYNIGVQDNRGQSLSSDTSALNNAVLPSDNPLVNNTVNDGIVQGAITGFPSLALHSVASVEKELNITLVLPSSAAVSSIDPSLKLLGVAFDGSQSPQQWEVTIVYSGNQTFVNGTSTIEDLGANGIAINEVPMPLGVNSSQVVQDILSPGVSKVCTISKSSPNSTVQCQTSTATKNGYADDYIVTQNGLSILVNPGGNIQWADGRRGVGVGIEGPGFVTGSAGLSASQLLSLASTMTASP
jgi:hypothetical protein